MRQPDHPRMCPTRPGGLGSRPQPAGDGDGIGRFRTEFGRRWLFTQRGMSPPQHDDRHGEQQCHNQHMTHSRRDGYRNSASRNRRIRTTRDLVASIGGAGVAVVAVDSRARLATATGIAGVFARTRIPVKTRPAGRRLVRLADASRIATIRGVTLGGARVTTCRSQLRKVRLARSRFAAGIRSVAIGSNWIACRGQLKIKADI